MGFTEECASWPYVAVVNSWGEMNPGHYHLKELAKAVKSVKGNGHTFMRFSEFLIISMLKD
jgi:dihydroxyacid dehydratase/phosphogluconate dehydratase